MHAKTFETSRRVKYVHITMVVVGLVLPTLPVIVTFTTGDPSSFGMTRFPPILCTGLQKDSTFYSLVLPINILMIIGIPLLIIIFWTIHKVMAMYTHNGGWPLYIELFGHKEKRDKAFKYISVVGFYFYYLIVKK